MTTFQCFSRSSRRWRVLAAASLCLASVGFGGIVSADPGATMTVSPETIEVAAGDTFTVEIVVDTADEASGVQGGLAFDPAVVRCDSVEQGSFFADNLPAGQQVMWFGIPAVIDNDAGTVGNISVLYMPFTQGVTGSGVFFTATFTALADGQTEIAMVKPGVAALDQTDVLDEAIACSVTVGAGGDTAGGSDPDLVVSALAVNWAQDGLSFTVNYTVKNQGGADAAASKVALYANNTLLESVDMSAVAAGATDSQTAGPFDFSGATVTVEACADADSAVSEGNEDNNCKEKTEEAPVDGAEAGQTGTPPASQDEEEEGASEAPAPADTQTPPASTGESTESGVTLPWVYVAGIGGAAVVAAVVLLVLRKNKGGQ